MAVNRQYGVFQVTLPGEEYVFEPDEMMASEWGMVETELGMSFDDWLDAFDRRDFTATQGLVWFLRYKAGQQMHRSEVDFKIRQVDVTRLPKDPEADTESSEPDTSSPSSESSESDQATGTG